MASKKKVVAELEGSDEKRESDDTKRDNNMSIQQKLDLIDEEIHKIHMFCLKSGYSPKQIDNFVEPFSKKLKEASRRKWIKRLLNLIVFLLLACLLFRSDHVNKFFCAVGRRAAIQIMPIYDWTRLYERSCLIENPLHESQTDVTLDDCHSCENLDHVERIKDVKEADLIQKYIKQDKPVIVLDGLKNNDGHEFSIQFMAKIFEGSMYESCDFNSNIKVRGHRTFLKQVAANEHKEHFASWRNCFEEPAKLLRHHLKRPYFLSSIVELADTNWVYVSSNYSSKMPKPMLIEGPMVMLLQMKGSVEVVLIPDKQCIDICSEISLVLNEGEILLVNDFIWMMDYYPLYVEESVGIGITGNFD